MQAAGSGFVRSLSARPVGHATMLLGAGRTRMDSPVDHAVGVVLHKKVGDAVDRGEPLCTLLVNDDPGASSPGGGGYAFSSSPGRLQPSIDRIGPGPSERGQTDGGPRSVHGVLFRQTGPLSNRGRLG